MRRAGWRRILYTIGVIAGALLFLFQFGTGYQEISRMLFHITFFERWVAAGCLIVLAFGLQMAAWSWLMGGLGIRLAWHQVIAGYTLSFLPRYIPGTIWGYISRSEWLAQVQNVPYGISNLGSFLEIVLGVTTAMMAIGIYAISIPAPILQLSLAGATLAVPFVTFLFLRWIAHRPIVARMVTKRFGHNAMQRIRLVDWVIAVALYLLLWSCYGASILMLLQAFDLPERAGLTAAISSFSASWLAGFLVIFVPAGLGVRELALSSSLISIFGLMASQASALAVISRFTVSLAEAIWILFGIAATQVTKQRSRSMS